MMWWIIWGTYVAGWLLWVKPEARRTITKLDAPDLQSEFGSLEPSDRAIALAIGMLRALLWPVVVPLRAGWWLLVWSARDLKSDREIEEVNQAELRALRQAVREYKIKGGEVL